MMRRSAIDPSALVDHPRRSLRQPLVAAAALLAATDLGCAAKRYPLPMTAAELGGYGGPALVAYLSQPDATADVCDLHPSGPHLARLDLATRQVIDWSLRNGRLAPRPWGDCVAALLRSADPTAATALLDDTLRVALDAILDSGLEFDAALQARVDASLRIYAERPTGVEVDAATAEAVRLRLQREVGGQRLAAPGIRRGQDLLTILELERARWQGRPLDAQALDELQRAGDERTLRWAAARLPVEAQRVEARRRIIRLHLTASPFPEVRQAPSAAEEAVLRAGANPISLAEHEPERGWLDPSWNASRELLVDQRLPDQTARLLAISSDRPTPAVIPALPLRGALQVELRGLPRPVTLCAPPAALDVTPCLPPSAVRLDGGQGTIDGDGVLRVVDAISEADAISLAQQGRTLSLSILVAGRRIASLGWRLTFATPPDLVLTGEGAGRQGPGLAVSVDGSVSDLVIYAVDDGRRRSQAVVERSEAAAFHVVSRGAPGRPGASGSHGSDGTTGTDGWSATCPSSSGTSGSNGGDGSDGQAGEPGGPGGPGGDVQVTVTAGAATLDELLRLLGSTVRSEGGPGGPGGSGGIGGSGGPGGRGGSGTTCSDADGRSWSLSGGSDGLSGRDGSAGGDGWPGPAGKPGRVTFAGSVKSKSP